MKTWLQIKPTIIVCERRVKSLTVYTVIKGIRFKFFFDHIILSNQSACSISNVQGQLKTVQEYLISSLCYHVDRQYCSVYKILFFKVFSIPSYFWGCRD